MKLNLGSGTERLIGYINLDKADIDLDRFHYPFKSGVADEICLFYILRHLEDPIRCLQECERILKVGGKLKIRMTHYTNSESHTPDHKTSWNSGIMSHLTEQNKGTLQNPVLNLKVLKVKIGFYKGLALWNYIIEPIVNINSKTRLIYENHFCYWFPAKNIEVECEKK